jgi:hypothetical protein
MKRCLCLLFVAVFCVTAAHAGRINENAIPKPTAFLYRHFSAKFRGLVDADTVRLRIFISANEFCDLDMDLYGLDAADTPAARAFVEQWVVANTQEGMKNPFWVSVNDNGRPGPGRTRYETVMVPLVVGTWFTNPAIELNLQYIQSGHAVSDGRPVYTGWVDRD